MEARETLSTREIAGGDAERDERAAHTETEREPEREPDTETAHEPRAATATEDRPSSTGDVAADSPDLLPRDENTEFQSRWETIQTGFVDEPRQTVEQADELVAQVMKRLAEGFAQERDRLEQQWGRGEDVSTEDLRIALQRYRSFFQRLLAA
jgi:hypothetical protein